MPINLQDEAEDCLGDAYFGNVILNNLEIEEILKINNIEELNAGCNINFKDNITAFSDIGVSGCIYLNQPLLNLKNDSGADDRDIGFYSAYQNPLGVTYYTGLVRDASDVDKPYVFFDKSTNIIDPCGEVDFTGISYSDVHIGRLEIKRPLSENSLFIQDTDYGDLILGTTSGHFIDLPLGNDGQILIVDSSSNTGAIWSNPTLELNLGAFLCSESGTWIRDIESFNYTGASSNITLIGDEKYTRIFRKKFYGAKNFSIINEIEDGPSGFFNATKSNRDIEGHIVKLAGIVSYTGGLINKWNRRVDIETRKCNIEDDGDYIVVGNYDIDCASEDKLDDVRELVNLVGVTCSEINFSETKGNLMYLIENDISGPIGIFYLTKNKVGDYASIVRTSHSPSSDCNKLEMIWEPNSKVKLCKTKNTFNGEYRVIPLHEHYIQEHIVTLTGTDFSPATLIDQYERVTTIVTVENIDTDGPSAIFVVSKNHITNKAHINRITATMSGGGWDNLEIIGVDPPSIYSFDTCTLIVDPFEIVGLEKKCGLATLPRSENIELVWDEDELLKIRKNDSALGNHAYDGLYKVRIYDYFTC